MTVAAWASERDLPIIAVKAGRSASGQKGAASHTGSLANEDRTVDAFFRQHGIWRVRAPHAQALAAEAYLKGWRPRGRRLVAISNSGAVCVLTADAATARDGPPVATLTRRLLDTPGDFLADPAQVAALLPAELDQRALQLAQDRLDRHRVPE